MKKNNSLVAKGNKLFDNSLKKKLRSLKQYEEAIWQLIPGSAKVGIPVLLKEMFNIIDEELNYIEKIENDPEISARFFVKTERTDELKDTLKYLKEIFEVQIKKLNNITNMLERDIVEVLDNSGEKLPKSASVIYKLLLLIDEDIRNANSTYLREQYNPNLNHRYLQNSKEDIYKEIEDNSKDIFKELNERLSNSSRSHHHNHHHIHGHTNNIEKNNNMFNETYTYNSNNDIEESNNLNLDDESFIQEDKEVPIKVEELLKSENQRFVVDNKSQVIIDTKNNKEWSLDWSRKMLWDDAKSFANAKGEGWRLPSRDDFRSLSDKGNEYPDISKLLEIGFTNIGTYQWVGEEYNNGSSWIINLNIARGNLSPKSSANNVAFVRNIDN